MRLIVEMTHPADVNFFSNALELLRARGWDIIIVTRGRENVRALLEAYGFSYTVYGRTNAGLAGRAFQLLANDWHLLRIAGRESPDAFLSFGSPYCSHVASLIGKPSIVFVDTETARLQLKVTYPFSAALCTPEVFGDDYGKKHHRFKGFKELAYLDPKYFSPNLQEMPSEFKARKYAILRINSFDAAHDIGLPQGLTLDDWKRLIDFLSPQIMPVILSEIRLPQELSKFSADIPPKLFHTVLAGAEMVISDSCTITTEAAILAVPAIFCHPDPSDLMNFSALKKKYSLIFQTTDIEEILAMARQILENQEIRNGLLKRRDLLLSESQDVTEYIVDAIERWGR